MHLFHLTTNYFYFNRGVYLSSITSHIFFIIIVHQTNAIHNFKNLLWLYRKFGRWRNFFNELGADSLSLISGTTAFFVTELFLIKDKIYLKRRHFLSKFQNFDLWLVIVIKITGEKKNAPNWENTIPLS